MTRNEMPRKVLEPFQVEGAKRLASNFHHLLGDEPGLGKTLQAIAAAEMVGAKKVLVICPASVRLNWAREVREWYGAAVDQVDWRIISYEGASGKPGAEARAAGPFDVVILDEAHFLKNLEAQRTRAVLGKDGLARLGKYVWPLTGTPVLNRPVELYPILKTLNPLFAGMSYGGYTQRYCSAFFDGRAMNVRGASRIAELAQLLAPFITRRLKKQVFPDRKEPIVQRVPVEISAKDRIALGGETTELEDQSRILRLLGLAKVPAVVQFVREQLETVQKVAVYAHHRDVLAAIAAQFPRSAIYHGDLGDREKADAVAQFQREDCRVFVGQMQAAGVGINGLQRVCSTVVIAEPAWGPEETKQIIGRFDRIGQADELVNAYILHAPGTDDDKKLRANDRKVGVITKLIDSQADWRAKLGDLA